MPQLATRPSPCRAPSVLATMPHWWPKFVKKDALTFRFARSSWLSRQRRLSEAMLAMLEQLVGVGAVMFFGGPP
eukprot:4238900-Alexandrium_andersonii.AAC.1